MNRIPQLLHHCGRNNFNLKRYLLSTQQYIKFATCSIEDMELSAVTKKLNTFAPSTLAGNWDNVGLLVEPTAPHMVQRIMLTNDLTEPVMHEALELKTDMILAYHPPIFKGMKRLTQRTWKERIVIKCLENRIAVYSPHTSLDALAGGVNDWLLEPFETKTIEVIEQVFSPCFATSGGYKVDMTLPINSDVLERSISSTNGVTIMNRNQYEVKDTSLTHLSLNCSQKSLPTVVQLTNGLDDVKATLQISSLTKPPIPSHGLGRLAKLSAPVLIEDAVSLVKGHLKLSTVRLATGINIPKDKVIKKVAVCAGSGSSVLKGVDANLYITGEMSHHEVLDANHRGIHVILCEHSNSERGYLLKLKEKLDTIFSSKIDICISQTDSDPLKTV